MQALLVALGLSMAGNGVLGWAWIETREQAVASALQRDDGALRRRLAAMRRRTSASWPTRCVAEGAGAAMRRPAFRTALLGLAPPLTACGPVPIQTVKVPVPVECRVQVPARPAMPTEALSSGGDLDEFSAAALQRSNCAKATRVSYALRLLDAHLA
jgi:hypothetical protein